MLAAVASVGPDGKHVMIDIPETLPDVWPIPTSLMPALAKSSPTRCAMRRANAVGISAGEVLVGGARRVDVRLIDDGPGIAPADRELVFQPFQRVVDHQADGTGVGLGLAISRGFIEAMAGELTIEDTPGGGTTMVVGLPTVGDPSAVGAG